MSNLLLYLLFNLALPISFVCLTLYIRNVSKNPARRRLLLERYRSSDKALKKMKKFYSKRSAKAYTLETIAVIIYGLYKISVPFIALPSIIGIAAGSIFLGGAVVAIYIYTGPHQKLRDQEW